MTQDVNDPEYYHENEETDELFVQRIATYINTHVG